MGFRPPAICLKSQLKPLVLFLQIHFRPVRETRGNAPATFRILIHTMRVAHKHSPDSS